MIDLFKTTKRFFPASSLVLVLGLVSLFIAYSSCEKPDDDDGNSTIFTPDTITPILVAKGDASCWGLISEYPQQNCVIKTVTEWDNFLNSIEDVVREHAMLHEFVDTTINFSTYQVIAVIDKMRQPYWTIDITDVIEHADKLIVNYTHLDTNRSIAAVVWQPYHIVKIPKSNKNVVFNYDEEKKGGRGL